MSIATAKIQFYPSWPSCPFLTQVQYFFIDTNKFSADYLRPIMIIQWTLLFHRGIPYSTFTTAQRRFPRIHHCTHASSTNLHCILHASLSDVPISQGTRLTQFIEQQRALLSNALIWYRSFCERTNRVCKRIFCQNKDTKDIERLKRDFYKINLRTMPPNTTNETFWDDFFFVFFIEIKLVLFCTCLLLTKKMIFN